MKASLRVGPVRGPKPTRRAGTPGKNCPNCGEERVRPDPGDEYPGWEAWVEAPHENPFDCIRFLRKSLDATKEDVRSVERELASVDAPRTEGC